MAGHNVGLTEANVFRVYLDPTGGVNGHPLEVKGLLMDTLSRGAGICFFFFFLIVYYL